MSTKTLPSIKKVEFIKADELTLEPKKFIIPGDTISVLGEFEKLNIAEPAQCEITSARSNNGLEYTTKITGSIYDESNDQFQNRLQTVFHCYRLTDIYNQKYLVGIDEEPYPEITFNPINPSSPSGKRVVNYEIQWVSRIQPVITIDL